jgi:hypothetical protein
VKAETEKGIRQDYMQIVYSVYEAYIWRKKGFEKVEYFYSLVHKFSVNPISCGLDSVKIAMKS